MWLISLDSYLCQIDSLCYFTHCPGFMTQPEHFYILIFREPLSNSILEFSEAVKEKSSFSFTLIFNKLSLIEMEAYPYAAATLN